MKITGLNKNKVPIVRVDKSLNKYDDMVLFPKKVAKANNMLKNTGLPKSKKDSNKHAA
jgi:hypothetical protein